MKLYGNGCIALQDDPGTAGRLGWPERRRSAPEPDALLRPVQGDPAREPWIRQGRPQPGSGPESLWGEAGEAWTYLAQAPGLDRYLRRMAQPRPPGGATVGIAGLGRVGGLAASALAAADAARTGIATLLLHDCDAANQERMVRELASVASWRGEVPLPAVAGASLADLFGRCDAVLFAAATAVPPLGAPGDVRLPQFEPNRAALAGVLAAAVEADYAGLFLMISDPVELLAQTAFHDSNAPGGTFLGCGLAPERVAGLALGVMWGRALAEARAAGCGDRVAARGVPYGPHSTEVLVLDDPEDPDEALSHRLTEAARRGNYRIRELGFFPFIGPALSSIALTLPGLLAGREVLASGFLDGVYFGAPSRLNWGIVPARRRLAPRAQGRLQELHQLLRERMALFGVAF